MPDLTFVAIIAIVAVAIAVFGIDRMLKASRKVGKAVGEYKIGKLEGETEYLRAKAEYDRLAKEASGAASKP